LNVAETLYWHEVLMRLHDEKQTRHVNVLRKEQFIVCSKCKRITCVCLPEEETQGASDAPTVSAAQPEFVLGVEPPPTFQANEGDRDVHGDLLPRGAFMWGGCYEDHIAKYGTRPRTTAWDDAVPDADFSRFFDPGFLETVPEQDPEETNQGAFADAAMAGIRSGVGNYFAINPVPFYCAQLYQGLVSPFFWGQTADRAVQELLSFCASTPAAYWWWWVPASVWEWPCMPRIADYLADDQIRDAIRSHYQGIKLAFLCCIFHCLFLWYFDALFGFWFWFSFLGYAVFGLWSFVVAQYYQHNVHHILTHKRSIMGHFRKAQLDAMPKTYLTLLYAVTGLATGYVTYRALNFLYQEFLVDEPRSGKIPDDILNPQFHVGEDQSAVSPLTGQGAPTCEECPGWPKGGVPSVVKTVAEESHPNVADFFRPQKEELVFDVPKHSTQSKIPSSEFRQGFMSVSSSQIDKRETELDVWKRMTVEKRASYRPPHGMTSTQMFDKSVKGLVSVFHKNDIGDWVFRCDAYFYDTGLCIMGLRDAPMYTQEWLLVRGTGPHERRTLTVGPENFVPHHSQKLAIGKLCFSSFAPVRTYFNHLPTQLRAIYCQRLETGELRNPIPVTGVATVASNGAQIIEWTFPEETAVGMCGGIYFSTGDTPGILGVHYAARTADFTIGISAMLSPDDFKKIDETLLGRPGVLLSPALDPDEISVVVNGKSLITRGSPPEQNIITQTTWVRENLEGFPPVDSLPSASRFNNHCYEIGSFGRRKTPTVPPPPPEPDPLETVQGCQYAGKYFTSAFYKSAVVDTIIADSIRKDFPDFDYGKPRFGRSMWPKGAAHAIASTPGLPREHLEWAIADWMSVFDLNTIPSALLKTLRPLTWEEVINGIDGVKFIDALNWGTSMGAGFPGGKRSWIKTYLDSLGNEKKDFVEEVWNQVKHAYEKFDLGERVPFLFVGTPKDEPTPTTKEKVRLFMVGEIASILLCRKYYTPVVRLLQMVPGWSECCVGLNATSPHWEDLWARFEKFPHVFDGDHAKYDVGMNADINESSCWCMMHLASKGNYAAQDLYYMACVASEFIQPLCAYRQDVVLLSGSTPSGIPVTVNINSLNNSLINRCAYKHAYPQAFVGEFRKYVSHGNYGDDFINSVHNDRVDFNFISMRDYMAHFGLKLTPGIKSAEGKPFVDSLDSLVFLQRFSSKLPELPYRVGKLSEKSILRQLICVMRGKHDWNLSNATAENADNALREWAYHGEETYENRREWLSTILEKHNIRHLSRLIDVEHSTLLLSLQQEWLSPPAPPSDKAL